MKWVQNVCKYDCDFSTNYMEDIDVYNWYSVVFVLTGSMEPAFQRGDILFLHMSKDPIRTGEIVVFNIDGCDIPIVHRVIEVVQDSMYMSEKIPEMLISSQKVFFHHVHDLFIDWLFLSGDNNKDDDRVFYAYGQYWLKSQHIMGRAVGFLPYVGWVTIVMTEKPLIKVA
ncbi:Microsomal signal peptidase 18 kDa subunit, putative [Ricinus communis]|uniref:signal peptidase I n=1 Tax=Ricinus communis TaxID=3988 RepID=B9SEQ8_RICCO|nr:Microsomal signal peptidase 18 kDa subunit, putative [Ricinus communis]